MDIEIRYKLQDQIKVQITKDTWTLNQATTYWVKIVQEESWQEEIFSLKKGSNIRQTSRLLSLSPFLDKKEVLRVSGRSKHLI